MKRLLLFCFCVVIHIITLYRHLYVNWDAFVNLFTDEQDCLLNLYPFLSERENIDLSEHLN